MSSSSFHSQLLVQNPPERHRAHGRAALDGLHRLFPLLPPGNVGAQAQLIATLPERGDLEAKEASQAWFELVSAHALDFHSDAGKSGTRWDLACVDALETWKLLRDQANTAECWHIDGVGFISRARSADAEIDMSLLYFGAPTQKRDFNISDWRRALSRRGRARASQEALELATLWPGTDLPSLAMALGCLWAVAVVGEVAGMATLDIGGLGGSDHQITIEWLD